MGPIAPPPPSPLCLLVTFLGLSVCLLGLITYSKIETINKADRRAKHSNKQTKIQTKGLVTTVYKLKLMVKHFVFFLFDSKHLATGVAPVQPTLSR